MSKINLNASVDSLSLRASLSHDLDKDGFEMVGNIMNRMYKDDEKSAAQLSDAMPDILKDDKTHALYLFEMCRSGYHIKHLSGDERTLLRTHFGKRWKQLLGYGGKLV